MKVIGTTINGLTVTGRLTTDHAASSYGQPVFVDDDGRVYGAAEIFNVAYLDTEDDDVRLTKAEQVYRAAHPLTPSESWPHIGALGEAGLLDDLTVEQLATIVQLMQTAYRAGQASRGAEKIDTDYVWLDGVGGLERQPDGTWKNVAPDGPTVQAAAAALGSITSDAKRRASRANGRKGGRPRKNAS